MWSGVAGLEWSNLNEMSAEYLVNHRKAEHGQTGCGKGIVRVWLGCDYGVAGVW